MKTALCIGINYLKTDYELGGAINDAHDWSDLLQTAGFDVAVMLEKAATKRNIICAVETIVTRLKPGDVGMITYSGHGTWVPDLEGDEPDGKDEAICPIDCQTSLLIDDELHEIFDQIKPDTHVVFVADCCHSGTLFRSVLEPHGLSDVRFLPPTVFTHTEVQMAKVRKAQDKKVTKPVGSSDSPLPGLVYFGGCRDAELANDVVMYGKRCGVFSYHATRAFLRGLKGGLTYGDVHRDISRKLPSAAYKQSPTLYAHPLLRKNRVFVGGAK